MTRIIALHGFAGGGFDFSLLRTTSPQWDWVCPDLPGHEREVYPDTPVTLDAADALLDSLIKQQEPAWLMGYSLGGRLALRYACQNKDAIKGLILISATAGLTDEEERNQRIKQDEQTAERIRQSTLDAFLDYWATTPMIKSQQRLPQAWRDEQRQHRLAMNRERLAQAVIALGQGRFPPLWDELPHLSCPVLLATGLEDPHYTALAASILGKLGTQRKAHSTLADAGHCAHLENASAFLDVVNRFVS